MSAVRRVVQRVRKPEYTGANRCIPCTVTNLAITAVVALGLGVLWPPAGVVFVLVAVGSIWLRGYLVPGTPELTKRYFPDWLLAKFDKQPAPRPPGVENGSIDAETVLLDAGVVEPCADVDDLCLTAAFETDWRGRMDDLADEDALRAELADALDLDVDSVTFESFGDAYVAREDDVRVGQWESRAALLADIAAARELPDHVDGWEHLERRSKNELLGGLRVFVETCPTCGGAVTADTEVVESCCRSTTVVAIACEDCEDRLLEVPYDEADAAA